MMLEMDKYIGENDTVQEFINDTYKIISKAEYTLLQKLDKDKFRTPKSQVYATFCSWINENHRKDEMLIKKEFNELFSKKVDSVKVGIDCYLCKNSDDVENNEGEEQITGLPQF